MALLHVDRGDRYGENIPLDRDVIVLGRSPDCDEVISKLDSVSRWHARILHIQDRYYIEDFKESRNRTFINEQKLEYHTQLQLQHQDRIKMCDFEATFLDVDSDSTVEAMLSSKSDHRLEAQPAAKLALLLEVNAKLSRTLQLDTQLPEIAEGLLKIYPQADRCFIILVDETTGALKPRVARARAQVDDTKLQFSKTIVNQCLKTGQAILMREGDPLPTGGNSVNLFHIRSVMCVPLSPSEGPAFGVIQLDTQDAAKKFAEDDLRLLWGVANQVTLAMENARLHEQRLSQELMQERVKNELEIARQVQLNFLPQQVPDLPSYEFFAYYKAAREVGGDYYDFVPLPEHRMAITVGDVAGKGMPAALLMARLSSEFRSCLLTEQQMTTAISCLNDHLYPATSPMDRFVTLIAAILDPASHTVTLVNAGHPTPLHYHHAERRYSRAVPAEDDGQSLGLSLGAKYQSYQLTLQPGDCLLLYSDGVTDAQNMDGRPFRMKGIYNILEQAAWNTPRALGERLVDAVQNHSAGGLQYDDITLLCFGRPAP